MFRRNMCTDEVHVSDVTLGKCADGRLESAGFSVGVQAVAGSRSRMRRIMR
ncbi:hypothetical protein Syun_017014 [Stephania yunnanensis]|uniref:Uncharacterized protein n=1 Tax=Stephania yunnanensis TaxID=152371 RepID=A0AAP0J5T5_9MAGN